MLKKITALLLSLITATVITSCGGGKSTSEDSSSGQSSSTGETVTESDTSSEAATEATTVHVSPTESVSSTLGSQLTVNKVIQHTEGSNTCHFPLADFFENKDSEKSIKSFTFIIYSESGGNLGELKGALGISVDKSCPSATSEGWYQSADFTQPTNGTYAEVTCEIPQDVSDHIATDGEVMFGYWWGSPDSIRIESVICTYTETMTLPVDGENSKEIKKSVSYNDSENTIKIPVSDLVGEGCNVEAVTFNISTGSGKFGKFTGAFGADHPDAGYYQSVDVAVFTDSSSLSLTWIPSREARSYIDRSGSIVLGYWWSEQTSLSLDSVSVKFSAGEGYSPDENASDNGGESSSETGNNEENTSEGNFKTASQIVSEIKVGWVLGNTFDCYNFASWTDDGETAWGNPKTTKEMIQSVRNAGFNAIRIPVTWGDNMTGDTINPEWMDRVQTVVDYAYDEGMFIILNMHHDDYTWFNPTESEYPSDSAKLRTIWKQISERFRDYDYHLLFEGMNEPRTVGSAGEWNGGTPEERAVINKYEQDFIDTVRASGGNNKERTLVITSYAASAVDDAINDIVIPSDKNVIISVHYYAPWNFAEGQTTEFTDNDRKELENTFSKLKSKFADKGTPVIVGEFGCVAAASDDVRADYYKFYVSAAKKYGIKCFVWDNNVSSGEQSFGIFSRESLKWNEAILKGIQDGSK